MLEVQVNPARRARPLRTAVIAIVFVSVVGAALALTSRRGVGDGAHVATAGPSTSISSAQITSALASVANSAGESNPTQIQWVATTQQVSYALVEGVEPNVKVDTTPVVLVEAEGKFTMSDAPRPNGAAAPTGTWLHLVLDSATGDVLNVGLGPEAIDLSKAGTVQHPF